MDEYHKTALVVIENNGKFLLVRRAIEPEKGKWCFPGGHLDPGETIQECIKREASEEVGVEIELDEYDPFFVFEHQAGPHDNLPEHIHRAHCFMAKIKGDPKEVKINNESSDSGWFTLEETKRVELTIYSKTAVNKLKEMENAAD
ncbi:MAG: NUDIX hydrolase [Nanoarchaeota archaeon]